MEEADTDKPQLDRVFEVLDDVERQIEEHRQKANELIELGQTLKCTLKTIKTVPEGTALSEADTEDVTSYVKRLEARLAAIHIAVDTVRTEAQVEALQKVETKLEQLILSIESDSADGRETLRKYLGACSQDLSTNGEDSKFEGVILSCCSDDQKRIRQRLASINVQVEALKEDDDKDAPK